MTQRRRSTGRELIVPAVGVIATVYVLAARGIVAAVFIALLSWVLVKVDDAIDDRRDEADDDAQ